MEKIEGIIEGVDVKEGVKQDGRAWKRMAYTVGGKKYSTFLDKLQQRRAGDFVVMEYSKSADGKYNTVETIQVTEKKQQVQEVQPEIKTEKVGENNNIVDKDRIIVRQNSLTQANSFANNVLKQVELGIISKEIAPKITLIKVLDWAKEFENHVFR